MSEQKSPEKGVLYEALYGNLPKREIIKRAALLGVSAPMMQLLLAAVKQRDDKRAAALSAPAADAGADRGE